MSQRHCESADPIELEHRQLWIPVQQRLQRKPEVFIFLVLRRKSRGSTFEQQLHTKNALFLARVNWTKSCMDVLTCIRRCLGRSSSSSTHDRKTHALSETVKGNEKRVPACSYHLHFLYMSPITTLSSLVQPSL